ncbi:Calx-beta domain-containing protein, partial [uncultured Massilia sp.]|uniref:Calx-beta domain-containing protein n=1 Tax=uncultured Massilia sp. TaxID=169973 RepID=UPI0025FEBA63
VSGAGANVVDVADGIGQATIGAHGQTPRAQPAISVNNPFVGEKDGYVDFVVTLDAPSQNEVSVYYNSYSLTAGSSGDFESTGGQLVFAPGQTTQVVRVTIPEDLNVEGLETFALTLNSPANAVIANFAGVATIVDDDTLADAAHHAALSVRDVVVDASADTATFAVVLDKAVGGAFSVAYGTANGSAVAGSDYVPASGTLTFGAGETVKTVTVALPHDGAAEPAEMFSLVLGALSGSGAGVVDVARGSGHATIGAHGQASVAQPLISVADTIVGEKDGYVDFVVSLNAPSASMVEVYYDTRSGTADTNDFESAGGKLVFAPGTTTQTVRVTIDADTRAEALESFSLSLGSPTNATLAKPAATATIVDGASFRQVAGGAGLDTAAYGGARADYAIAKAAGGGFTVAAHGGTDLLSGVERLHFGDTSVALDIDGTGGQAYRIYQAAFNRTPDKGGLGFWMNAMDHGTTLTEVAAGFMQSKEFIDAYGSAPSNLDLVSKIYMNVLHRPAEQAGLDYWTNALDQHVVTAAQALGMISESAENQGAVAAIIGNGFDYTPYG